MTLNEKIVYEQWGRGDFSAENGFMAQSTKIMSFYFRVFWSTFFGGSISAFPCSDISTQLLGEIA